MQQLEFFKMSLNLYSLIILVILAIVFYSKERMHNAEDNIYSNILIIQILSIVLELIYELLISLYGNNTHILLTTTINKLCVYSTFLVVAAIDLYIYVLHTRDTKLYGLMRYKRFVFECSLIFLITMLLPEKIILKDGWYYPTGPAFSFGYFTIILGYLFIVTFMIIDRKNIKNIYQ